LFKPVPSPARRIGDKVSITSQEKKLRVVIVDIGWHFKRAEPIYFVATDGKKRSKRYWQDDFDVD
jgi:hypothetical protein